MASRRNHQHSHKSTETPFHILPVAEKLIDYTLDLTDNTSHFPKKVRFTITNRIQERVLSIYENLVEANEIFPVRNEDQRNRRLALQQQALTDCKLILFYIGLSKRRGYIDAGTFDYWTKITLDVKYMTAAWYKAGLEKPAEPADDSPPVDDPPAEGAGPDAPPE